MVTVIREKAKNNAEEKVIPDYRWPTRNTPGDRSLGGVDAALVITEPTLSGIQT